MQDRARPLKTVRQHNAERLALHKNSRKPTPSGIACPSCGAEMVGQSDTILLSHPPQVMIYCPECGQRETVYV